MGERTLHRGDVVGSSPASSTICILTAVVEQQFYFIMELYMDVLPENNKSEIRSVKEI